MITDSEGPRVYNYDGLRRLTRVANPAGPSELYSYDPAGNRISDVDGRSFNYTVDDRLLSVGSARYSYDAAGRVVLIRRRRLPLPARSRAFAPVRFHYDATGRMTGAERGGVRVQYKYGPLGRRIEKSVDGAVTRYLYNGSNILQVQDGDGRLRARFTHGPRTDEPLVLELAGDLDGQALWYHADALGSVRLLTDDSGAVNRRYRYDSFGQPRSQPGMTGATAGASRNLFLFTGREWDAELGLYFYRARHYDPSTGRFLQPDPVWNPGNPSSLNRYVYVQNNPVNLRDPSGLDPYAFLTDLLTDPDPFNIDRFFRDPRRRKERLSDWQGIGLNDFYYQGTTLPSGTDSLVVHSNRVVSLLRQARERPDTIGPTEFEWMFEGFRGLSFGVRDREFTAQERIRLESSVGRLLRESRRTFIELNTQLAADSLDFRFGTDVLRPDLLGFAPNTPNGMKVALSTLEGRIGWIERLLRALCP